MLILPFKNILRHEIMTLLLFSLDGNCKLQLFQAYLFMQEHFVNEWETCIRCCNKKGLRGWKATYTTTQYNNNNRDKTAQLDFTHLEHYHRWIFLSILNYFNKCVRSYTRAKSHYECEAYCACNYKASAIMASQVN